MNKFIAFLGVATLAGGMMLGATLAHGQIPGGLRLFDRLTPGLWLVRDRDASIPLRRLCVSSSRPLIQIHHPNELCSSFVVQDDSGSAIVHYTCPGGGYGRTHVRMESVDLVQIETQGIADGFPFDSKVEARRVGPCRL